MVYVAGPEEFKEKLKGYGLAASPEDARCAVIQIPGNTHEIERLAADLPVLAIVKGMMSLADVRATKKANVSVIKEDELTGKLNELLKNNNEVDNDDDDDEMICFEEFPDNSVQEEFVQPSPVPPKNQFRKKPQSILAPRTMRGIIVSSYSASGGEGKTFMATNIGVVCAMEDINTVIVDFDLGFGDVDVATGLVDEIDRTKVMDRKAIAPKNGWATVTSWRPYLSNFKANTLRHSSGLYVVPAFPYAGKELPVAEVEDILDTLAEIFDMVVVDLGVDGYSNQARVALRKSNAIMIVAGQDRKTIAKLSHFLTQEGGWNEKMHLVFNKKSPTAFYNPKEIAKKMSFSKYYTVPLDENGVNAAKLQRKLVVQLPGSPAGEAVRNVASAVLPFGIGAGEIVKQKNGTFFSRLFARFKKA